MTISNEELIQGILAMPDKEYMEIIAGVLSKDKLDTRKLMIIFAYAGNTIKNSELDPAQKVVLQSYISEFKLCQGSTTKES
jgi:hypothetical protein